MHILRHNYNNYGVNVLMIARCGNVCAHHGSSAWVSADTLQAECARDSSNQPEAQQIYTQVAVEKQL
jgi:hypothetical protein